MGRRIFYIIACLSMLLCALSVAMLVETYRANDHITWSTARGKFYCIESRDGCVWVSRTLSDSTHRLTWQRSLPGWTTTYFPNAHIYGGPTYHSQDLCFLRVNGSDDGTVFRDRWNHSALHPMWTATSHWGLLAIGWIIIPAMWGSSRLIQSVGRRVRSKRGLCTICSYDLRASSGRCPECGTVIPAR